MLRGIVIVTTHIPKRGERGRVRSIVFVKLLSLSILLCKYRNNRTRSDAINCCQLSSMRTRLDYSLVCLLACHPLSQGTGLSVMSESPGHMRGLRFIVESTGLLNRSTFLYACPKGVCGCLFISLIEPLELGFRLGALPLLLFEGRETG